MIVKLQTGFRVGTRALLTSRASTFRAILRHGSDQTKEAKTALYNFHVRNAGKIVNFGGYALPVQYAGEGIAASHIHTRQCGSIFDVSHMLQTYVRGKNAIACIESITTADIAGATSGSGILTVFTNAAGGILDDLIITKVNDELLYVVSNAAMKQQDINIMETAVSKFKNDGKDVSIEFLTPDEQSLIAVQGPRAVEVLSKFVPKSIQLDRLFFMNTTVSEIAGVPNCRITRCGYTGEDGVELSIASGNVEHVTEALLSCELESTKKLKLAGLGPRDSLRLEAGMCLYGSDINAQTTPIEASLAWLVAKRRRNEQNFPGAEHICHQIKTGVERRRVGIVMSKPNAPPARSGAQICYNEKPVGQVTSGCPSPSLAKNIAMGYIANGLNKTGTKVQLKIRDKFYDALVANMPFVTTKYFVRPK